MPSVATQLALIEDLRNDVARRSIPFELDNREIALAADRKNVDLAIELGHDLSSDDEDIEPD